MGGFDANSAFVKIFFKLEGCLVFCKYIHCMIYSQDQSDQFLVKSIYLNLSKCTKISSINNLEVADKFSSLLTKITSHVLANTGLKDGISGNILAVYSNL